MSRTGDYTRGKRFARKIVGTTPRERTPEKKNQDKKSGRAEAGLRAHKKGGRQGGPYIFRKRPTTNVDGKLRGGRSRRGN